eukprot:TRINITY_DN12324_c0_g1_i1.p4 TRINITY_DN12324_c0_g1~~TRINITY_DN12324_c0_g1_i1.p4  ORF type:complete len:144 (-),score=35.31 TRINITY_DN12324_c0_g1_i1:72-503(-)
MAGLVLYYNTENWLYLRVTHDDTAGVCVGVAVCDNGAYSEVAGPVALPSNVEKYYLEATILEEDLQFSYGTAPNELIPLGPVLDASKLSDDYCRGWCFTGAFAGLCAQDLSGQRLPADFQYFDHDDDVANPTPPPPTATVPAP